MLTCKWSGAILFTTISLAAADTQADAWRIVTQAIRDGGPDGASALKMLGAIDDRASRATLEATLKSHDGAGIGDVAAGLTPEQCASYLADLSRGAEDPGVEPADRFRILDAIARAGNGEAAQILAHVADSAGQPIAGVAFGLLDGMGTDGEPPLVRMVTAGRSAWSRETAASMLRRLRVTSTRAPSAVAAFRAALHDSDGKVRVAGALGLAQFGNQEGTPQLETAAGDPGSEYQIEALVGLAILGRSEAFDRLEALVTSRDEAVRGKTVWAMAWSGSTKVKQFAYRLGLDHQPVFRSMLAEKLLDPNDSRDLAMLEEMVTNGDDVSQLIAAQRLVGTKVSARAESTVARALASESDAVRHLAVKMASGYPALRPALAKQLAGRDPEVQVAALSAIVDLHQEDRFGEVTPYLASKVRAVSAAAARTLVALDPKAAKSVLEGGLNSKSSYVRIHSAAMLLAIAARSETK